VLVLSAHSDDPYVDRALDAGASGFLIKQTSAQVLSKAIREVKKGNTFFSPSISKCISGRHPQASPSKSRFSKKIVKGLTSREMEVIQMIAEGAPNKKVAADLGISIKTVEKHRQHLMDKLNIHDTAGLTRYAISHGIIENSVQVTII
jgi:DNA-binding NarL/FixJ family response regulator